MTLIRNQAISNAAISFAGIALGYLNIALLFPRLLGDDLFGLTQILTSAMLLMSNLGSLAIQNVAVRYAPIFKLRKELENSFFSFSVAFTIIGLALTNLALLIFSDQIKGYYVENAGLFSENYILLYALTSFSIIGLMLDGFSKAVYKTILTAFFKEVGVRILQLACVVAYFFNLIDQPTFLWLYVLVYGVYVLMMYCALLIMNEIKFVWNLRQMGKKLWVDILKYGGISTLSGTSLMANNLDILMVGSIVGLKGTAVYSVASAIGKVIIVPARSVSRIAWSVVGDAWSKNDIPKINRIYRKSAITSLISGGFIFIGVVVNLDSILRMLPKDYDNGFAAIILLSLARLVEMSAGINSGIIATSKDYVMNLINNLLNITLALALNQYFISVYGITGAAISNLILILLSNTARHVFLKIKYGMEPFSKEFFLGCLFIAISIGSSYFIPVLPNILMDVIIRSIVCLGVFISLVYFVRISDDVNELTAQLLRWTWDRFGSKNKNC